MMKKLFFLFAMLASIAASAQSHINIEMLGATYTVSSAVKFRVSWTTIPNEAGKTHNAKIWLWIDYVIANADNTTSGNTWTRAEISATPVVSSSPVSTASLDASTNKGFWLNGVAENYSATVTASFGNIPANTKFNWCAYASDYPPNVVANTNGSYTLAGTPPFRLIAANGISTQTVTGKTIAVSALSVTPATITDATACPGLWCPYAGSDLYMDDNHRCLQRQNGAQNWEAWISDSRIVSATEINATEGRKYYRIVQINGKWWMAQNLDYRKNLTWRANSNQPFTSDGIADSGVPGIGNFWCPGGYSATATTSTRASCDTWGALYTWEAAMSLDGTGSWNESLSSGNAYSSGAATQTLAKINNGRASASAINGRGICPTGWHVPTDYEWQVLFDAAESNGGTVHQTSTTPGNIGTNAGQRLRSAGMCPVGVSSGNTCVNDITAHWYYYAANMIGTDYFGFSVIPNGRRWFMGTYFEFRGIAGTFWTSSISNLSAEYHRAWVRFFGWSSNQIMRSATHQNNYAMGIRCTKN